LCAPRRLGLFSYGSGCCSEFFSGVATEEGQRRLRAMNIDVALDRRYRLSIDEYETLLLGNSAVRIGTRDVKLDHGIIGGAWDALQAGQSQAGAQQRLVLNEIAGYHRKYRWV
jgi:polyketide biosynthesis 3-hydroxy-3-methylglutaryl-CoA synthase-like enzyme PksG